MNEEIIFQTINATSTGVGSTTGKEMEEAFNENFELVKKLLTDIILSISIGITSNEMKQIRVDTSTSPYTLYYSLQDESVQSPTWIPLLNFSFAQLTGSPTDNIALKTVLDGKAPQSALDSLTLQVNGCITDITSINNEITGLKNKDSELDAKDTSLQTQITANKNDITNLNTNFLRAVLTEEGSSLWLRFNSATNQLDLSTNQGESWTPSVGVGISWEQIEGVPSNSTSLVEYVSEAITQALTGYVQTATLTAHTSNMNNPHNVTPTQLGLGNVLNDIAALKASASTSGSEAIVCGNNKSFLINISNIPDKVYLTSSSFARVPLTIEGDAYYDLVSTISGTESYQGPDGTTITIASYEEDPSDLPIYYKAEWDLSTGTSLNIYFNQDLYDYIEEGGQLV